VGRIGRERENRERDEVYCRYNNERVGALDKNE
jgi:hypothetical protein